MSYPPTFESPEKYLEECTIFFKKYQHLLRHQNNELLIKNVLDHIEVSETNLQNIDIFDKDFDLSISVQDDYIKEFFSTWQRLQIYFDDVEDDDLDGKLNAPLNPKKRYEILKLVKEVVNVCEKNSCDLLVDFGSGLGYIDQLLYEIADYKVLGLECNESHHNGAEKRQKEYHEGSKYNVKFLKHTVTEESPIKIKDYLEEEFPNHGPFCLIGLHACADLTVEAIFTFLKMEDAKALVVLPCCYHKMSKDGATFKYFPLSDTVKNLFQKHEAYSFAGTVTFLRLAAEAKNEDRVLYEKVFSLLVRAVLELYAEKNGFTIKRKKRKPVKLKNKTDFESYILDAAKNGYTLVPKSDSIQSPQETCKNDEVINFFNMDELRCFWREVSQGSIIKKAGIYVLMQEFLQPLVENFVHLDRLMFLKERGVKNCWYKKIFNQRTSPRCLALEAVK